MTAYRRMPTMIRAAFIGGAGVALTTIGNPHARRVGAEFTATLLRDLADLLADTLARRAVELEDTGVYAGLEAVCRRAEKDARVLISDPPAVIVELARLKPHLVAAPERKRRAAR